MYKGDYECDEIDIVRDLIRPDDVVLELGSGCGVVSAFIAQQLHDSANLHTYEANPKLIASINAIASVNSLKPNVTNAAVGMDRGEAEFFVDEEFVSSSLYDDGGSMRTKAKVPIVAMEDLLEKVHPTFIFFDVEGAEKDIFKVPIPQQVRAMCGELHPQIIGDHAVSQIIRDIIAQGFDMLVESSKGHSFAFVRSA
nr:FkbM family methyltransferase [Microvirga sp. ACRRW]